VIWEVLAIASILCDLGSSCNCFQFFMSFKFRRDSDSRFGTATKGAEEGGK
jgi:hypothetical protein